MYPIDNPIWYDLEVLPDWFEAGFRFPDGKVYQYVITPGDPLRNFDALTHFLNWTKANKIPLVGFNSNGYDDIVLTSFIASRGDPEVAYNVSQNLIVNGHKPWDYDNQINSIDLMPVLPGRMSLKKLGVCMGHERLQELPIAFNKTPTAEEQSSLLVYNDNDLEITKKLYHEIYKELKLRQELSKIYHEDLRSRGEASLAEVILLHKLGQLNHENNKRALNRKAWEIIGDYAPVKVSRPVWWDGMVQGKLPIVSAVGEEIFAGAIALDHNGRMAKGEISRSVFIDDRFYTMGVGGLHSLDGPGAWVPDEDEELLDIDVDSFYPRVILSNGLYPRHWGPVFLEIYEDLVNRRLKAKRSGDMTTADVLKIAINGTYGKSSDIYSSLFDPQLTANVTLLGQLSLLLLIELLVGTATVCSANTDGILVMIKRSKRQELETLVKYWEEQTGFTMSFNTYRAFYQRDVNSYVALSTDGKVKAKGEFINKWPDLRHTPFANIAKTAVQEFLDKGTDVETTIYGCTDVNQFMICAVVTGNVETSWNGIAQTKVLRFYKSNDSRAAPILRRDRGTEEWTTVPDSSDCMMAADLPDGIPDDLNYAWYINRAKEQLATITRRKRPGLNRWAQMMHEAGLPPCIVTEANNCKGRAKVKYGGVDFTSMSDMDMMAVKTGLGVIAKVDYLGDEIVGTTFYRTSKAYPGKTRPTVAKNHGFTLYYGARVAHTGAVHLLDEVDWDQYFTPAELKKVGR